MCIDLTILRVSGTEFIGISIVQVSDGTLPTSCFKCNLGYSFFSVFILLSREKGFIFSFLTRNFSKQL